MTAQITVLAERWSRAVDSYQNHEAAKIENELIPLLRSKKATSREKAVRAGRYLLWIETRGSFEELAHEVRPDC